MSTKKPDNPSSETYEVKGHSVEIRRGEGGEQLYVDGVRQKILVSKDGYNLYGDAYVPPYPTLIEAVEAYYAKRSGDEER